MVLPLSMFCPGREVAQFPIISIICKPHLGPNEQNLLIMHDDSAIVYHVLVNDGPIEGDERKGITSRCNGQTFRDRTRCPPSHLRTRSLPELPKNEERYRLGIL